MANLKTEAAKHGANGILLNATGNQQQNGFVFMPGAAGAAGIAVPYGSNDKTGNAVAIFVTKE
ncbi:hypothetical protein BN2497_2587 [Janthinobacterium sp. CG23_2]|nr:hypothetical protein BN2497_2587 [Janthinobacterium sp. CG23_2]CUU27691.1 hypothetical protein BN3177_2587 [Janthinobacterium sp. CG23_2]